MAGSQIVESVNGNQAEDFAATPGHAPASVEVTPRQIADDEATPAPDRTLICTICGLKSCWQ
ncbi:MAG: hypothetical protein ACKVVP_12205 [Chloroflexota bacterium]